MYVIFFHSSFCSAWMWHINCLLRPATRHHHGCYNLVTRADPFTYRHNITFPSLPSGLSSSLKVDIKVIKNYIYTCWLTRRCVPSLYDCLALVCPRRSLSYDWHHMWPLLSHQKLGTNQIWTKITFLNKSNDSNDRTVVIVSSSSPWLMVPSTARVTITTSTRYRDKTCPCWAGKCVNSVSAENV